MGFGPTPVGWLTVGTNTNLSYFQHVNGFDLIFILDLLGTFAFAISGIRLASGKNMNWIHSHPDCCSKISHSPSDPDASEYP